LQIWKREKEKGKYKRGIASIKLSLGFLAIPLKQTARTLCGRKVKKSTLLIKEA